MVVSLIVIFQRLELGTTSATVAVMWSPGETDMLVIVSDGAGTSSHHAE